MTETNFGIKIRESYFFKCLSCSKLPFLGNEGEIMLKLIPVKNLELIERMVKFLWKLFKSLLA